MVEMNWKIPYYLGKVNPNAEFEYIIHLQAKGKIPVILKGEFKKANVICDWCMKKGIEFYLLQPHLQIKVCKKCVDTLSNEIKKQILFR